MNITYWLTNECNFRCKYCYVEKSKKIMSEEISDEALIFTDQIINKSLNDPVKINFHGGEPLLNFEIINRIYTYLEEKHHGKIKYYITTNGSILTLEIIEFLSNPNVELIVSLDGQKNSNDFNRVSIDGQSSHDKVLKFLSILKKYKENIKIRMTINPNNIADLFDNFKYIYQLGHKYIVFSPDEGTNWDVKSIHNYEQQLEKVLEFLHTKDRKLCDFYKSTLKTFYFTKISSCDGGISSFHINADGIIYPCILSVGKPKYSIGSTKNGLDENKVKKLLITKDEDNTTCKTCKMKNNCRNNKCKIINEIYTGNPLLPKASSCRLQHIYYNALK
ncbi:MAG: radical SAM protein [Longicatena sp.]